MACGEKRGTKKVEDKGLIMSSTSLSGRSTVGKRSLHGCFDLAVAPDRRISEIDLLR